VHEGVVVYFNMAKNYGFILEDESDKPTSGQEFYFNGRDVKYEAQDDSSAPVVEGQTVR